MKKKTHDLRRKVTVEKKMGVTIGRTVVGVPSLRDEDLEQDMPSNFGISLHIYKEL